MDTADSLTERFGLPDLTFNELAPGFIVAAIDNVDATAMISLQGAQLMSWWPRIETEPVIWLSPVARPIAGKAMRGGVPICWPWFGPHGEPGFPAHGFVRTAPWDVVETRVAPGGETIIALRLRQDEKTRALWPHQYELTLLLQVGITLKILLTTANTGEQDFVISEALHTYFQVGGIAKTHILGLEEATYVDKVAGGERRQEGAVSFHGETDRVYLDTGAACVIEDAWLGRAIHVTKSGSASTVIWNPGAEKAEKLGDLGPDGWQRMVCVESANALSNAVSIKAGARHTLAVEYRVER